LRYLKLVFSISLVALLVSDVSAFMFGIRYSNLNEPVLPAIDRQDTRGRLGVFFGAREKGHDFLIGLEYDRYKQERGDTLLYSRRITASIGYRYRLFPIKKAEAMKMMPSIGIYYFKSFGRVDADSSVMSSADRQYYKDLTNDQGIRVSLGAEYYLAPAFSLGCEGGIRYTRVKSKAYGYTIKISEYRTFAAILLSFYW
jgi:hypothetical protein